MNKTSREAIGYMKEILPLLHNIKTVQVWFSVPFTAIHTVFNLLSNTPFKVGAQNMNDAQAGAFTGEVAGAMLQEEGASFVLLGHSERRRVFHETDEFINKKMIRAFDAGLTPILCVGETLEEREAGKTTDVVRTQIMKALEGIDCQKLTGNSFLVAYEPVWAIGTGKSATNEIVDETHAAIRHILLDIIPVASEEIGLLYGGSVSEKNASELSQISNVNGFLIGTASLQPTPFATIIQACDRSK